MIGRLLGPRTLVAFDFDGTLAPLAARPEQARLRQRTRKLLGALSGEVSTAVISGRALRDVRPLVDGLGIDRIVGNHGLEGGPPVDARRLRALVNDWETQLRPMVRSVPGLALEHKGLSLTLHHRQLRDKAKLARTAWPALRALKEARIVGGKECLNALPAGGPDKGAALRSLLRDVGADAGIYVGDDVTDEDVFSQVNPARVLTVRVGRSRASAARLFLNDQPEVDSLLALLLDLARS